jgi:type I restriction enzyme S subunit
MRKEKLSSLCKVSNGFAFRSSDYVAHGYRVMRITNVQKGHIVDNDPKFISQEIADELSSFKLRVGDILISLTGNVGRVGVIQLQHLPAVLNQRVGMIRPSSIEISDKYLFQYLNSDSFEREAIHNSNGVAQLNLSSKWIESHHIPLPSLDDQIRIAHLLSKVEGLIAQRKQHLKQLDDLLKSVFLEMFGDPVRNERGWDTGSAPIYADMVTVGVVVKPASYYVESGIIALRSLNVKPNRIDLNDLVYFSQESNEGVLSKSRLKANDVVVVRTGKTGTAAVVPATLDGANCIDLIVVRLNPTKIHPQFFTGLLNSERGMALVSSLEVGGIQKHFNVGALNKIPFPLPPIRLQGQFADIVEKVGGIKSRYQQSLTNLETLYGALSQLAFKGELDLSRVPLPDTQAGEEKTVASEPPPSRAEEDLVTNFIEEADLMDGHEDPETREFLLAKWLEAYRGQLKEPFSVQSFMAAAQTRMTELKPEFEYAFDFNDYECIKRSVFDALAAGLLEQAFDDSEKSIELKAVRT